MSSYIHSFLTFIFVTSLIISTNNMKISSNSKLSITTTITDANPQELSCDDVNPPFIPNDFTDGIFSKVGLFMTCQNNFMIQFTSTKWLGQQTYQIKNIEPGVYTIYNATLKKYVGFSNNLFHCV
jgi:hypothetical protein